MRAIGPRGARPRDRGYIPLRPPGVAPLHQGVFVLPPASSATVPPRVLLVHGLLNASSWLRPLASRLRAQGFVPELFGYSSLLDGPQHAVPRLVERLRREPVDALVGHSLGGLIALEALRGAPELVVPRVVCIGTPLRGSLTARNIAARPWTRPLLGRSAQLLQGGLERWGGTAAVGLVAGDVARGMGRLFARFEGGSDGTVGLDETRLPGLADHCIVHSSHTGLVFSREAVAQAAHFLRHGRFEHPVGAGTV
ncbi:MAG: alpha/beta fold hydrolase [Lysobacteraceae bacterium]|nr:MAG: alpha/beta fold hydrolase [Xanthomonadaceae bacterium]